MPKFNNGSIEKVRPQSFRRLAVSTYSSLRFARPIGCGLPFESHQGRTERAFMDSHLFCPFGILLLIYVVKKPNMGNIQQFPNLGFRDEIFSPLSLISHFGNSFFRERIPYS